MLIVRKKQTITLKTAPRAQDFILYKVHCTKREYVKPHRCGERIPFAQKNALAKIAICLGMLFKALPATTQEHSSNIRTKSETAAEAVSAPNWDAWIPNGWTLLNRATGDLDFGSQDAAVIALEKNELKENSRHQDAQSFEMDRRYGARRLLVLVRDKSEFRMALQSDKFLPSQNILNDPCSKSSVSSIEIRRKKSFLTLVHEFACGIGAGGDTKFTFQQRENRFRLIGVDATYSTRDDFRTSSRNYLTGEIRTTFGRDDEADSTNCKVIDKKLKQHAIYLDEIGSAVNYEIHGEPRPLGCK